MKPSVKTSLLVGGLLLVLLGGVVWDLSLRPSKLSAEELAKDVLQVWWWDIEIARDLPPKTITEIGFAYESSDGKIEALGGEIFRSLKAGDMLRVSVRQSDDGKTLTISRTGGDRRVLHQSPSFGESYAIYNTNLVGIPNRFHPSARMLIIPIGQTAKLDGTLRLIKGAPKQISGGSELRVENNEFALIMYAKPPEPTATAPEKPQAP